MSEVFIPLGGAGGKNRGGVAIIDANATIQDMYGMVTVPLPAGNYKKYVADGNAYMPGYGDGKNAVLGLNKEFIKKAAIHAFGIASITNFSLAMYAHKQVRLTWARPLQGLWSGVHFVFKYDSMPTSVADGFMQVDSADVYYTTSLLQERRLYVRAYNYVTTNEGRWYDNGDRNANIQVSSVNGSVSFGAGAGTWTVPANVYKIRYILVGQGGFGGRGDGFYAGGGGGGGYVVQDYMNVTPGQQLSWIVPTFIYKGSNYGVINTDHPGYTFTGQWDDAVVTRLGDRIAHAGSWGQVGDRDGSSGAGGKGGSGGGTGRNEYAPGGTNGSSGGGSKGGAGQGSTTVGFNGVMYASGGNGGSAGKPWFSIGDHGTDGLGNGGGGGKGQSTSRRYYQADGGKGGTGCIYIAWGSSMNDGS